MYKLLYNPNFYFFQEYALLVYSQLKQKFQSITCSVRTRAFAFSGVLCNMKCIELRPCNIWGVSVLYPRGTSLFPTTNI